MADVEAAVVVGASPGARAVVGGLPLAARVVFVLRRLGVADVAVAGAGDGLDAVLDRAGRKGPLRSLVAEVGAPAASGLAVVVAGDVLLDEEGLAPLLAAGRPGTFRLAQSARTPEVGARALVCPRSVLPAILAGLDDESGADLGALAGVLRRLGVPEEAALQLGDDVGLFVPLDAAHPPGRLEELLLDNLARRSHVLDSFLAARIDRRLSRPVTRWLLRSPATPSQITAASIVAGLVGAAGLATVSYGSRLVGVLALIGSIVLDCVDGEVARARYEQSAAGARLDVAGDYLVNLAAFVGLGIGLTRQGLPPLGLWAALALVAGVAAAMATVHGIFIRPALVRGGDLHWQGDATSLRGTPVADVVEKLASRDYTYLLLVCALLGHLEWFLYAAAGGSWLFVAGLLGYFCYRRLARPRAEAAL